MKRARRIQVVMRRLCLCLALAGLSPARLHAATPGTALVIGSDANTGQPGCEKTASAVGTRLHGLGFTVQVLLHPTVIALRSALDDFAADQQSRPPGTTLIYACAGAVGEGSRLFVLPVDLQPDERPQPQTQGVVAQALLNALSGSGGTLYADLSLPKGRSPNGFVERVPEGLHLAVAVTAGGDPVVIGRRLADPKARVDEDWPGMVNALQSMAGAATLTLLPLPTPPAAEAAAETPPPVTPAPTPPPRDAAAPPPTTDNPPAPLGEPAATVEPPAPPAPTPPLPPAPVAQAAPHPRPRPPGTDAGHDASPPNDHTARIQTALARRHIYTGSIDGLTGPVTVAAIRSFQGSLGDEPTGVLTRLEIVRLLNP
jgi:hypothetical protein